MVTAATLVNLHAIAIALSCPSQVLELAVRAIWIGEVTGDLVTRISLKIWLSTCGACSGVVKITPLRFPVQIGLHGMT